MAKDKFEDRQKKANRESFKRKLKSRLPKIIKLLLLGLVVVFLFLIFTKTSIFNVKEIEVTGGNNQSIVYADDSKIEGYLEEQYLDQNFFILDPEVLSTSVIRDFPFVRDSWVEKVFPVGLLVYIEEKQPFLHVQYTDECYLIDDNDTVIISLDEVEYEGEDPLTCDYFGETYNTLSVSVSKEDYDAIFTDSGGFILFEQVYQANQLLDESGFESDSNILFERELQIRDEKGRTLIFDPFGDFEDQLKRFVLVFNQGDGLQQFRVIDFRYERPVLRE